MSDTRVIRYGDREFPLEPGMTLDQAKDLMARHFPELANPKIDTKKTADKTTYIFSKQAGHKGAVRRAHANTATITRLLGLREWFNLDKRIVAAVVDRKGDQVHAASLAVNAEVEAKQVIAIRVGLDRLPNAEDPRGSVL
jgi:PRTRC genetic system protein C